MPRTLGGLVGFIVTAALTVFVGLWIINRVPPLRAIINGQKVA
jgi:hypothetical protein